MIDSARKNVHFFRTKKGESIFDKKFILMMINDEKPAKFRRRQNPKV